MKQLCNRTMILDDVSGRIGRRIFRAIVFCAFCFAGAVEGAAAELWDKDVSFYWAGVPLRESLSRLGAAHRFGVFLDRRVDPERTVSLEATREPLGETLERLADSNGLGIYLFENCVYLGPPETARVLPTLLREHDTRCKSYPAALFRVLRKKKPLRIPILATPRTLLEQVIAETGLAWQGLDAIEHDLWNENELPAMSVLEQLTLLLAGFDATFEIDVRKRRIEPIPLEKAGAFAAVPDSQTKIESTRTGKRKSDTPRPAASSTPSTPTVPTAPSAASRYTLTIKSQPLRTVLEQLTERMGLDLEIDEDALHKREISLERPVSFEVKNATAAALFSAATRTVGAQSRIRNTTLYVY